MANKTPEQEFAEASVRLAISQKYLARDPSIDPDPSRQEQLDRNRIPGQFGGEQLSPYSDVKSLDLKTAASRQGLGSGMAEVSGNFSRAISRSLRDQPNTTLGIAAVLGFVLGAIWKA